MSVTRYTPGQIAVLTGTFSDASGAAIDPTSVRFRYRPPGGVVTTWTFGVDAGVTKAGPGVYVAKVDTTGLSGVWNYRWESTGTGQAATESIFTVDPSALD